MNQAMEDYENGFGNLDGEFWIGLGNIYEFTNQQDVDLQISVWNEKQSPNKIRRKNYK